MCSTLFGGFLRRHCKTSMVDLDWNGNLIVNGDRRDFDFLGNTHTEAEPMQSDCL